MEQADGQQLADLSSTVVDLVANHGVQLRPGYTLRLRAAEGYGSLNPGGAVLVWDAASHKLHTMGTEHLRTLPAGSLYFQKYAGGFGWGLCIWMGEKGKSILIRSSETPGGKVLNMTTTARLVAHAAGVDEHSGTRATISA